MLWRALKDVDKGFYIDIGAWSPDIDSVTRAFYDRGWSGINVEPNPVFHEQLIQRRNRDINLKVAVADFEGKATMNFVSSPGLSTINDEIAKSHESAGCSITREDVKTTTLANLYEDHVFCLQPVHFLKVDVEGLEDAVLRGNDWQRFRPWIVVVEATMPMAETDSYDAWQPTLFNANYQHAYSDGLNRFYVSREHMELLSVLIYPPNIFDDFVLNRQLQAETQANQAETRALQAETQADQAETRALQAEAASNSNLMQLHAVYNSTSWRITAPLRLAMHQARLLRQCGVKARFKVLIIKIVRKPMQFAISRPRLKCWGVKFARTTNLYVRLMHFYSDMNYKVFYTSPALGANVPSKLSQLSPRARRIYSDLKAAIEQHEQKAH
jgi:FkbM family methyltransferase